MKKYWCRAWESNPQRGKSPADFKPAAYANFASPAPANAANKEYHAFRLFQYSVPARFNDPYRDAHSYRIAIIISTRVVRA
jgi:hypothetical protein